MSAPGMLDWLRSTIESDKGLAEVAASSERYGVRYTGHWTYTPGDDLVYQNGRRGPGVAGIVGRSCSCCGPASVGHPHDLMHIALHDPRDTIARCEAELALLDEHAMEDTGFGKYCRVCSEYSTKPGEESELEPAPAPCRTVLLLAAIRRHRPGFNPDWVAG